MYKVALVLTFCLLLISLISGFIFLQKDQGKSKRVMYALGCRLIFTASFIALLIFGLTQGKLNYQDPWDKHPSFNTHVMPNQ